MTVVNKVLHFLVLKQSSNASLPSKADENVFAIVIENRFFFPSRILRIDIGLRRKLKRKEGSSNGNEERNDMTDVHVDLI